mgnify:CR=1 FL=1
MGESLRGKLLVASLKLTDPNFARTVVLMCMHDDEGALGLVSLAERESRSSQGGASASLSGVPAG